MENKKTKLTYFNDLKDLVQDSTMDEVEKVELLDFIEKQLDSLEKRRAAAAARAEKRKSESDALTSQIFDIVKAELESGEKEYITIDEVLALLDDETLTRNKISARLGILTRGGDLKKRLQRIDKVRKSVYSLAEPEDSGEAGSTEE